MGKQPVKMKAVVYALSPFQQKIMSGLWKDLPTKITHKVSENWISATLLLTLSSGPTRMSKISKKRRSWNIGIETIGKPPFWCYYTFMHFGWDLD
ncbi:hypothetical protein CXB51_004731 [Gossypium anomalum]|uniref:Cytochrome b-c1 complex subunit 8 n=1 Tax=Gossypium anomalum TaxID=47600 RepID=A0A8J6DB22_9ROSI|nr:hypothetical protein CXB51_004731 [Gossypium anomalum]